MAIPNKVINMHSHLHKGDDIDAMVKDWEAYNIRRFVCLCIGGSFGMPNGGPYFTADNLLPWMKKYPDMIIGFADVDLGPEPSPTLEVEKRKDQGFSGLKFFRPAYNYNDERYFHLYEAAEKLEMPILFHTGYVSPLAQGAPEPDVDSMRMNPGCLDQIARGFPKLTIIGAYLGHPWFEVAWMLALEHKNLYFDMSGGSGRKPHLSRLKRALAPFPGAHWDDPDENTAIRLFEKLVFATDNPPPSVWIPAATEVMEYLHIPEHVREFYWWKNAAHILHLNDV